MAFQSIKIDVSKRDPVKKEFVKVGEQTIFVPVLKDVMGFVASEVQVKDGKELADEDGIPLYISEEANWVQGAIIAAVKAQARNKMKPGTADLKDGAKIATDWAELIAEGGRGDGAGLRIAREFKDSFSEWVAKQGLAEAAAASLIAIVGNKNALMLQNETVKGKVKARLEAYAEAQTEEILEKFMRPLGAVMEATSAEVNADF